MRYIEPPLADVDRVGQNLVNGGNSEVFAAAGPIAIAIEPLDDLLDAKGSRGAVAIKIELVDEPDAFGFHGIDGEPLLDLGSTFFGFYQPVAERGRCTIPEPLPRILLHRPDDVLGILSGLVLIKECDHLAHHRVDRLALVADRLCDRDDPDVMLRQLPQIKLLLECLAKKPAVTVDEDHLECLLPIAGALDHLLEDGSAIIAGRGAGFDELRHDSMAFGSAP